MSNTIIKYDIEVLTLLLFSNISHGTSVDVNPYGVV